MAGDRQCKEWVSYLRVSTHEQALRELSMPNQRRAIEAYADRNGHTIAREYADAGCSATDKLAARSGRTCRAPPPRVAG